jgi:hypothetical protein
LPASSSSTPAVAWLWNRRTGDEDLDENEESELDENGDEEREETLNVEVCC